jgi:hypothetical protein
VEELIFDLTLSQSTVLYSSLATSNITFLSTRMKLVQSCWLNSAMMRCLSSGVSYTSRAKDEAVEGAAVVIALLGLGLPFVALDLAGLGRPTISGSTGAFCRFDLRGGMVAVLSGLAAQPVELIV